MAFETFDFGKVLHTVEAIKAMKDDSVTRKLQQQYMQTGEARAQAQDQRAQGMYDMQTQVHNNQQSQFNQEQQIKNTRYSNAFFKMMADDPSTAPYAVEQMKALGIVQPNFDLSGKSPEEIKAASAQQYEETTRLLQTLSPKEPTKLGAGEKLLDGYTHNEIANNPKQPEQTSSVRDYEYAKTQGFQGSFQDWETQMKKAGASNVNVNTSAERAADKAYGEAEGKAFADVVQRGQDASDKAAQLRSMRDNPAITGPTQDFRTAANALFSDLGIPISEQQKNQISNLQQYKAIANQLVLTEMVKQKGPQTDKDAARISETFGKTTNIQEANKLIVNYQLALADRETLLSQMAEEYRQRTGKIDGWRKDLRDYVRSTPLAGIDPESKRLVFWNEFIGAMKEDNPGMGDEEIMNYWRSRYGGTR